MTRRRHVPPRSLRRKPAKRKPKVAIVLFCEGGRTEPTYFEGLRRSLNNSLVQVEIVGGVGVPQTVVDRAVERLQRIRRRGASSFERNDEVWALFDEDEHPHVAEAVARASARGVSIGYSNPCFELWLLLHICDHDAPVDRKKLQKKLSKVCGSYNAKSKSVNFNALEGELETAEMRAEAMEHRRNKEGAPGGNPSTTVYKLTRSIKAHMWG